MYGKIINDNGKNTRKGVSQNFDVEDKITDNEIANKDIDQVDSLNIDQNTTEIDNTLDIDQ